jgi:hypothetical protein
VILGVALVFGGLTLLLVIGVPVEALLAAPRLRGRVDPLDDLTCNRSWTIAVKRRHAR